MTTGPRPARWGLLGRLLVAGVLSALLAGGAAVGPASADTTPAATCSQATAEVAAADSAVAAAQHHFAALNRPLGTVLAAERAAARSEVRTSRAALHHLRGKLAATHDAATRQALRTRIAAERADVRHGSRLLASEKALLAQVRTDRAGAAHDLAAAKTALRTAQDVAAEACADDSE